VLRWGENRVEEISEHESLGPLLRATFDLAGNTNECHLSPGDSGGAAFLFHNERWELAGIHYAVDGPYRASLDGPTNNAALFNHQGFYWQVDSEWVPTTDDDQPAPSALYATDVSAHAAWILEFLEQSVPEDLPAIQESSGISGAYIDVAGAEVDAQTKTITVPIPTESIFYRLRGCEAYRLISFTVSNENLLLGYE
jgi:hypothetical protein